MSRVQVPSPAFSKPKANALGFGVFGRRGIRLDLAYPNRYPNWCSEERRVVLICDLRGRKGRLNVQLRLCFTIAHSRQPVPCGRTRHQKGGSETAPPRGMGLCGFVTGVCVQRGELMVQSIGGGGLSVVDPKSSNTAEMSPASTLRDSSTSARR
jgi:hypothetical protein